MSVEFKDQGFPGWFQDNPNNPTVLRANVAIITSKTGGITPIVSEFDYSNGSIQYYEVRGGIGFNGPRVPLFTQSASGAKTIQNQGNLNELKPEDISKIESSVKSVAFRANQKLASDQEKEDLKNSPYYKSQGNSATPPGGSSPGPDPQGGNTKPSEPADPNEDDIKKIEEEGKTIQERGKKDYEDVVYPIGLDTTLQDCIKFSIIKYTPSGLGGFAASEQEKNLRRVFYEGGNPNVKGDNRERLATIVLPIPGGIQDTNQVNWSDSQLDPFMESLGKLAQTGLEGGQVVDVAQKELGSIAKNPGTRKAIMSKFTSDAIKGSMIMQRQFGAIINPNMELLFNSPYLRTFSFSFKLSPRSSKEAENVKKIIRNFKQAMSVKRSNSSFLLQTPHTFAISYVFQDKQHPYLNKFKECALTSCSVNYTPEGNYMSFDDSNQPSMVSYQLDLQFQELEPLYDDDYGNDYANIGY